MQRHEPQYDRRRRYATRETLAPFFWTTIAKNGLVITDVSVTNAYRVSYPGYSEILTGLHASALALSPNSPTHTGAIPWLSRYPPFVVICWM